MEILPENLATVEKRIPPWDEWLRFDNRPRIIQRGEDFDETTQTVRKWLVTETAKRSLDIVSRRLKGDRILFQVFTLGGTPPKLPALPDARTKYPWAEWFDGNEHELRKGAQFHSTPATFKAHVYKQAAARGVKVTMEWPFADVVKLRAYIPEEET